MCQCSASPEVIRPDVRLSVLEMGRREAERFKWIESERVGYDLGDWAIRHWVREHWNGFLRDRWLEHLQGRAFWVELDHNDFGLLQRQFCDSDLIDAIVWRLQDGGENLDILCWAHDEHLPMDSVLEILEALHINSRRIEFQLETRLAHAG